MRWLYALLAPRVTGWFAWLAWPFRRSARKMHADFEREFPGMCSVCAYHAYGIREGFVSPSLPPVHAGCPEGMRRFSEENRASWGWARPEGEAS